MSRKKKNKGAVTHSVPRIFKKPLVPVMVMLLLDVLALAVAAALRYLSVKYASYVCVDVTVISVSPFDGIAGIVMAVLLVAAAGIAAFMIVGTVFRAGRDGVFPAGGIAAALALLAVSVGVILFSANYAGGEKPISGNSVGYEDDARRDIIIAESEYKSGNRLQIFQLKEDNSVLLIADVELSEMSEDIESRYTINSVGDNIQVSFFDKSAGGIETFRTLNFTIPT